ncbi:hypothetical protein PMAYCL1PPCAC_32348 [Pristionchus mayeri]|uniref:Uncharacterized protein n=1 Tax=Pristionchus mayeri TaxID=1317129 RepID=A0AAN5DFB6_9BILA|nr:hypothetical protein PMAYCL1PPCAC_32348 [Pristionchus mayeri]
MSRWSRRGRSSTTTSSSSSPLTVNTIRPRSWLSTRSSTLAETNRSERHCKGEIEPTSRTPHAFIAHLVSFLTPLLASSSVGRQKERWRQLRGREDLPQICTAFSPPIEPFSGVSVVGSPGRWEAAAVAGRSR